MPASCRCTIVMNAGISLACETTDMHMHIMNCANFFGFIVRRCVRFQCTHANAGTGLCECRWDVVWQQNHAAHTQSQPDNCVCVCVGDVWPNEGEGEIALMWSANHRTRAGIDCSLPVHNFFLFLSSTIYRVHFSFAISRLSSFSVGLKTNYCLIF